MKNGAIRFSLSGISILMVRPRCFIIKTWVAGAITVAENVILAVTRNFVKEIVESEINSKKEIVAQMNGWSSTDMYLARTIRLKIDLLC